MGSIRHLVVHSLRFARGASISSSFETVFIGEGHAENERQSRCDERLYAKGPPQYAVLSAYYGNKQGSIDAARKTDGSSFH
jgi:hypothetical protein